MYQVQAVQVPVEVVLLLLCPPYTRLKEEQIEALFQKASNGRLQHQQLFPRSAVGSTSEDGEKQEGSIPLLSWGSTDHLAKPECKKRLFLGAQLMGPA